MSHPRAAPPTISDIAPRAPPPTLLREYLWADDLAVAVREGGQTYYLHVDHIGRPVLATNQAGAVVWRASYTPFGGIHQVSVTPGALSAQELRFPGQWFQAETGLHQNWMRDYDPTTGRYLQADPLGLIDGPSVYGYARQSPLRYTDPRGEYVLCALFGVNCGRDRNPNSNDETQGGGVCVGCPPCRTKSGLTVLVDTLGYRWNPDSRGHWPYEDVNHVHLYEARQNPNNCRCFWHNLDLTQDPPPPAVAINIGK